MCFFILDSQGGALPLLPPLLAAPVYVYITKPNELAILYLECYIHNL